MTSERTSPRTTNGVPKVIVIGLAVVAAIAIVVMARYVDSRVQSSTQKASEAMDAARAALEAKTEAQAEAAKTVADSAESISKIVNAYESAEEQERPKKESQIGWVYLGICRGGIQWYKAFFDNLPECTDGPLLKSVNITSVRGVSMRKSPPAQGPVGPVVNRIRTNGTVQLSRMVSVSPLDPKALRIFWGEVKIPEKTGGAQL
jgi:type II secretory pathway pseudopilin PulG